MSASSPSISKRLHISGLTPSITPADLATRFQAFGVNATSVEGFNKLDALGRPRGYGYVQVVGKEEGVKRCITSLSGTTWKGAKLRIGDAKPDFRERLERDRNTEPKPRVKRRRINAIHAPITDLVNPDVAKSKKGYHVTETGRVVTVVRMRPAHPLGPTADAAKSIKVVKGGKVKKEKRGKEKKRDPSNRARRRTIDMVRYGSVYLKGAWLGEGGTVSRTQVESEAATVAMEGSGAESSGNSDTEEEISGVEERTEDGSSASSSEYEESEDEESPVTQPISTLSARSTSHATAAPSTSDDFAQEKTRTLGLLQSLFGEGDDWGGRESVSDIEIEDGRVQVDSVPGEEEEGGEDENEDEEMEDAEEVQQLVHVSTAKDREDVSQEEESEKKPTKLKDLFAPREEEGGFSLLGHLDLDLELDEDLSIPFPSATQESEQQLSAPIHVPTTISSQSRNKSQALVLDPSQPLFFPVSPDSRANRGRIKVKDIFDAFEERGWGIDGFARREDEEDGGKWEEEAKKRWEEEKGELTRGWKRRWREAGKVRRRRGGGDGDM